MSKVRLLDKNCVCPWWFVWTFDNPLRRLVHPAERILGPYVRSGATAADVGCGRGHFTMGLARLVGPRGRVYAVDVQSRMLKMTERRVRRAGLSDRVTAIACSASGPSLPEKVDFILLSWMLHEVPDQRVFLRTVAAGLAEGGTLLLTEPVFHVGRSEFEEELAAAEHEGWTVSKRPAIRLSLAALLERKQPGGLLKNP